LIDIPKKFITDDYVHDFYSCAKFGQIGEILLKKCFFIYTPPLLRNTPTTQTARQIYTLNSSNDADSRKDVRFVALVDIAAHLEDQIAQKPQFLGRE